MLPTALDTNVFRACGLTGVSVDHLLAFQRLDVYRLSKELLVFVQRMEIRDAELDDNAKRAAKSQFLALAEGLPDRRRRMRVVFFTRAQTSLCECVGAVDGAGATGAARPAEVAEVQRRGVQLDALIRGLMR